MYVRRAELFELVWSQPRTTLARQLNVSDVAIAKKCRAANIPMPAPGYWTRVTVGIRVKRPALPLRIPGEPDLIAVGEPRYGSAPSATSEEPKPPAFDEDVDQLVEAAVKSMGTVKAQRDLSESQSGLARVLKQEEEREKKFSESKWSHDQPRFADASSQRQLRIYSALLRAFARLGIRGSVSDDEQWQPGVGSRHRLAASLSFGGAWVQLSITGRQNTSDARELKLRVGSDEDAKAHAVWADQPRLPIEKQLDQIARSILVCAEHRLRAHAQHIYEWKLRERERRTREQDEKLQAAQAKAAADRIREQQMQRRSLYVAAARWRRAIEVRSLVSAVREAHPELAEDARFLGWCDFAATEADRLDPVRADWTELLPLAGSAAQNSTDGAE
jgi:hypothetical protein